MKREFNHLAAAVVFFTSLMQVFAQGILPPLPPMPITPPVRIIPLPPPVPITLCFPVPSGCVGWWPAEGNGQELISGNNGIAVNSTYTAGVVGHAFAFDPENYSYGTYTGVEIADQPAYALTNSLTIEGWVRPRGDGYIIFWRGDHRPGLDPYYLSMQANNTLRFGICDANGDSAYVETTLNYFVWTHVAATLDGGSGSLSLYTNGVLAVRTKTAVRPFGALEPDQSPGIGIGNLNDGGNNFPFTGDIDEISLYNRALTPAEVQSIYNAGSEGKCQPAPIASAVPAISNFAPRLGTNGAVVTISGANFSANAALDIVRFGAVTAKIVFASQTNLVVKVPAGAIYAPITVTVSGLTAGANAPFMPTFVGDGSGLSTASFGPPQNLATGQGPNQTVIADLDGDGKPDLIVANNYNNTISIFRNISTNGSLTADSFAPRVDLPATGGTYSPYVVAVADVDGDGKLDIIATEYGDNVVSVYRNVSTPGNLDSNSFATRVDFATGAGCQGVAVKDLDGDGRPDIVTANAGDGTISILRNLSVVGSLTANSFAPRIDIATGASCERVAVGDLNGDGKPDIVTANDGTVSILQNMMVAPGSITSDSFAPKIDLPIPSGGVQVAIVDIDGDNKPDLALTTYLPQIFSVFHNVNTGGNLNSNSFAPRIDFPLDGRGHTIAVGDLDGDGKPDLVVDTELNSLISIFRNVSTPGVFTNSSLASQVELATGWNAWGVSVGDLDGDGRPDIVFANTYDNTITIYQNQVRFGVPSAPFIVTQPASQTAVEGGQASLSVIAGGTAPFGYQWSFNGSRVAGATNATLVLPNLHPWQAGDYSVRVTNFVGAITSSNAWLTVTAQNILIYKYAGSETVATFGQQFSYAYSGELFFIPDTTNAVFVGWGIIHGKKQYWVSPISDYRMITISVSTNQSYTVLGKADTEVDSNGRPHLWSFLHQGENSDLLIGAKKHFSFPNTFNCSDTHIYPDAQTSNMILRQANSTYTFSSQSTQTANNTGETVADLVSILSQSLAKQGYALQ